MPPLHLECNCTARPALPHSFLVASRQQLSENVHEQRIRSFPPARKDSYRTTPISPLSSYFVETASWSEPREITNGRMHGRKVDMLSDSDTHGWNCNSFGYKSIGDKVPEVITTLPNRLKRGAMAREESRQAS